MPELRGPGVQGCFVTQTGERMDARFDACGSFSDHSFFWLLFYELIILLMPLSPPPALGYSARLPSLGPARKWMKGFAEYLSIFFCSNVSSFVQSQLAKHRLRISWVRKVEPRPCSVLYKDHIPQKIWVVTQWSANQSWSRWVILLWDWTYPMIGIWIEGLKSGEGTSTDLKLQKTVSESTVWGMV